MKDHLEVFLFDQTTYRKKIQGRPCFISWNLRANRFFFSTCGQILDLTRNCLFKGVRLRKVSHWPPWLIKIFRKRVKEVRKRVSWKIKILIKKLCCLHRSYWVMRISKLLEISQMMLDQCIVMTRGPARWRCSETLGSLEDLTTCEVTKTSWHGIFLPCW